MSWKLRKMAARAMSPVGAFTLRRPLDLLGKGSLLMLGFHRVLPVGDPTAHAGDLELISATPENFLWQMRYLARRFEPVSCAQIAAALGIPAGTVRYRLSRARALLRQELFDDGPATGTPATDTDPPRPTERHRS